MITKYRIIEGRYHLYKMRGYRRSFIASFKSEKKMNDFIRDSK
jgi:hypothetical protein